jgi:hypothetical protein
LDANLTKLSLVSDDGSIFLKEKMYNMEVMKKVEKPLFVFKIPFLDNRSKKTMQQKLFGSGCIVLTFYLG